MKDKLFTGLADQKTNNRKKLQILEIGAGGGTNFTFYPSGSQILCLDPNPNYEGYLVQSVETSGVEMKGFITGFAERMDTIEDNSLDAVVCSMVLCSVKDLNKALMEIKRVLKPDGKFYYLEHVAAERGTVLNRVQKLMNPAWHCCTGDCEITRETGRAIASAGFSKTWMEHFNLNTIIFMIKPFLLGTATK